MKFKDVITYFKKRPFTLLFLLVIYSALLLSLVYGKSFFEQLFFERQNTTKSSNSSLIDNVNLNSPQSKLAYWKSLIHNIEKTDTVNRYDELSYQLLNELKIHNYNNALNICDSLMKIVENPTIHFEKFKIYMLTRRHELAKVELTKAIEMDSTGNFTEYEMINYYIMEEENRDYHQQCTSR